VINKRGYRLSVGIIIANKENKLFWGKRLGSKDAWQFPQGGIKRNEEPEEAMYRELYEEVEKVLFRFYIVVKVALTDAAGIRYLTCSSLSVPVLEEQPGRCFDNLL